MHGDHENNEKHSSETKKRKKKTIKEISLKEH